MTTERKTLKMEKYAEAREQIEKDFLCSSQNRNLILIPENLIFDTPNDQELGEKVRKLYWESKEPTNNG